MQNKAHCWKSVNDALKNGLLIKPDLCDICKTPPKGIGGNNLQAHHFDYNKPLDVIWLCKSCHMKKHYGMSSEKKDNSTILLKVALRKKLLNEIENPFVSVKIY